MKKTSLLKIVVVMGLSLLLVANLVSVVFADNVNWDDPTLPSNNSITNTADTNTANTSINTTPIPEPTNSITTNSTNTMNTTNSSSVSGSTITTLNTSTNDTENEVNNLAYTGIENNSMLVVVILIGAIVAGYSFKKIKEYNNI